MDTKDKINKTAESEKKGVKTESSTLDDIIKNAQFPEDYAAFEDENLDMIP